MFTSLTQLIVQPDPETEYEIPNRTTVIVKSVDKQKAGEVAARIRALRPPNVYNGKGIRYAEEVLRLRKKK